MAISFANPYHLLDVPMMKTFINAYTNNEFTMPAVIEKMMGRSPFKGKSPVDPSAVELTLNFSKCSLYKTGIEKGGVRRMLPPFIMPIFLDAGGWVWTGETGSCPLGTEM